MALGTYILSKNSNQQWKSHRSFRWPSPQLKCNNAVCKLDECTFVHRAAAINTNCCHIPGDVWPTFETKCVADMCKFFSNNIPLMKYGYRWNTITLKPLTYWSPNSFANGTLKGSLSKYVYTFIKILFQMSTMIINYHYFRPNCLTNEGWFLCQMCATLGHSKYP